ncbi:hypothetical protein B5X24_HaOG213041 [Helicoverpa armigera]|nr:hypothetical protein B5X24_HaOG213041 [Helicoverpa armigera]
MRCWLRLLASRPLAVTIIGTITAVSTFHMATTSCAKSRYFFCFSFSAFTRFSSCGTATSIITARRANRSITTISGLLATTVLSVMIDRSQYNVIWSFSRTRSGAYL